ncbi:MAG: TldD/PmbA family protein [Candidatus Odinarchaeota archaeon]
MNINNLKQELSSFTTRSVETCLSLGVDHAEAFALVKEVEALHHLGNAPTLDSGTRSGYGLRVALGKKIGFSSSSSLNRNSIRKTAERAVNMARVAADDPHFEGFAGPTPEGTSMIIGEQLLVMTIEELVAMDQELFREAKQRDPRLVLSPSMEVTKGGFAVANSNGVDRGAGFVLGVIDVMAILGEGSDQRDFTDLQCNNTGFDSEGVIDRVVEGVTALQGSKPLPRKQQYSVLFDPWVSADLIQGLEMAISGQALTGKNCPWEDRIGDTVVHPSLTIRDVVDDEHLYTTIPVDHEGTGTRTRIIVDKGMLKSQIFDDYHGKRHGTSSTGNALRAGRYGYDTDHEYYPRVCYHELTADPVRGMTLERQLEKMEEGIYIQGDVQGISYHHIDKVSGNFTGQATRAYYVKRGGLQYPLKPVMINGNLFAALERVTSIGEPVKKSSFSRVPRLCLDGINVS